MDMMRKKPELLSPAGDMEKLKMAVAYGADAVYLGRHLLWDALLRREFLPGGAAPCGGLCP